MSKLPGQILKKSYLLFFEFLSFAKLGIGYLKNYYNS